MTDGPEPLTEHEREMLQFERAWWRQPGAKENAIRDLFDMSGTRYYQLLNVLLDDPRAVAYDPVLVNRLLRVRAARRWRRRGMPAASGPPSVMSR